MTHQVKRIKNSNGSCSSDLSSSWQAILAKYSCPLGDGFSFNEPQEFVMGFTSGEKVFSIDWIRKEILNYAIYNETQQLSRNVIKNIRLVQKSWLATTSKLITKFKDSLLVEVTPADDDQGTLASLNQFTETFDASTRLLESFLPFKLTLDSGFFHFENYPSLTDCFTRVGDELVKLEIMYPFKGANMSVIFTSLHLPILRKLSFQFSENVYIPIGMETLSKFKDNKFGLQLLQSILNASEALKELVIPFTSSVKDVVPATFESLQLPPTIVSLQLELKLKSKTLEIFFERNQLPNLKDLTLQLHSKPLDNWLMHKILDQFRKTLTRFYVGGVSSTGRPYTRSYLQFPQMEKLELINIYSTECELGPSEPLTNLDDFLPKLNSVCLWYQTEAMIMKWVGNSRFANVTGLSVSVINEHISVEKTNYFRPPSREIMTQLNSAFPNVRELTLHVNMSELNVLVYLFRDMVRVQKLAIMFHGKFQGRSSNLVDSTLTGIELKLVGALKRKSVNDLERDLVLRKYESETSIRKLSELTSLTLWTENESRGGGKVSSLISDLLFVQTFLKMPKLQNLILHGKFQPSVVCQKQEQWTDKGGFIQYSLE